MTAEFVLVLLALACFVAAMIPTWPDNYRGSVGGLLLAVALLVSLRA